MSSIHPVAVARQATQRRASGCDESGFTLIELLVVVVILPLIIGGIAAALLAVFGLQDQTQNRISDSNDAQVGAAAFNKDVQSAEEVTTAGFATAPGCGSSTSGPSGSQAQVLGLEWGANSTANGGYETVVSYVTEQLPGEQGLALVRQECVAGQSTTPSTTKTISRDFPTTFAAQCPAVGTPANCLSIAPATVQTAAAAGWTSTQGVTGITFYITEPGNQYSYTLTGLPGASTSTGAVTQVQQPTAPGCSFANPGTGTYASQLCFADFTKFTDPATACQEMTLPIENSSDTLEFCVIASPQNSVRPQSIPTYYSPGASGYDSEAYLGNNGFYTGIPGLPALSQRPQTDPPATFNFAGANTALTTVSFTNVKVVNPQGTPQSGWTLVTGDAESTDTNGWLEFQNTTTPSPIDWNILPNSSTSLYGNSCYDSADTATNSLGVFQWLGGPSPTDQMVGEGPTLGSPGPPASSYAKALNVGGASTDYATGAAGILCEGNTQLNKTGAMMVASPEPSNSAATQNVTVTMQGEGYQAIFLGVLL